MTQHLIAGANAAVPTDNLSIRIISATPIDSAAYRLTANQHVRGDGDMIFYGQTHSDDATVSYRGHDTDCFFDIHLGQQPASIDKIALAFSSDQNMASLGNISLQVLCGVNTLIQCEVNTQGRTEKALILGELYRRQGAWKFRFVSQGFDGGLKPLSEHFGVEIADDGHAPIQSSATPTQSNHTAPPPVSTAGSSSLNLSKITLTKNQSSINLAKRDDFGKISINLNWHQAATKQSGGLLSNLFDSARGGIDLDLGAFVRLSNGDLEVIQALGGNFGQLERAPYVKLRSDDRTGASLDGEWLDINGKYWQAIQEVLIYAFIYEGAPNWGQTDGKVTIQVPNQPPIETQLTEGSNQRNMCAIARLVNDAGSIRVERINHYFKGYKEMDQAFGWGFSWRAGRK